MSYGCQISFKKIPAAEVYEFLQKFKAENIAHLGDIAEDNYVFSPISRNTSIVEDDFEPSLELKIKTEEWAKENIFKFRWFYNKDLQLLGVYGVYDSVQHLFDKTVYFQNSCDQNYDRSNWEGIKLFEEIFDKWMDMSDEEVEKEYQKRDPVGYEWSKKYNEEIDFEYEKKTYAYEEIWNYFESTLYDDSSVVHLSLFGKYDFTPIDNFCSFIIEKIKEESKKWKEKSEEM